jgi:hypothetical protein
MQCFLALDTLSRRLIAGSALCLLSNALAAQEAQDRCAKPINSSFVQCVGDLVNAAPKSEIKIEPIRGYLEALAQSPGYQGDASDLDKLKHVSSDLKKEPEANSDLITPLDNAIASHVDELRSRVSYRGVAMHASAGTNIYPDFVRQKLEFLGSKRAEFYDGGPFEVARRTLYASALEAKYFLDYEKNGSGDGTVLHKAIEILAEILERARGPSYVYLPRAQRSKSQINSMLFWQASLWLALGENKKSKEILHVLATENHEFALQTTDAGHIYIYRIFNRPYKMIVKIDGTVDIADPTVLNRFYNPAQLALVACSCLLDSGNNAINRFTDAINSTVFNDYYVVVAASDKSKQLASFGDAIGRTIDSSQDLGQERDNVLERISKQENVGEAVQRGARLCDVDDGIRDQIYSPFKFQSQIEQFQNQPGSSYKLVFGGRLNERQGNTLAEFLNMVIMKTPRPPLTLQDDGTSKAHVERMVVDQ